MPVVPDSKDWTWVLQRPCPECGFDATSLPRDQIAALIGANARDWQTILTEAPERLTTRGRDDRWSPLGYACHVRDVFRLYNERLRLMLTMDDPTYPNWDQDASAIAERYNEQVPAGVASDLTAAAEALALTFDSVEGDAWHRRGLRSDGAEFNVESFGRYMIHDPVHHVHDVTVDLTTLKSRS